jgi:putative effector of murein hydrolase LrgA (UPF0299 family)
VSGLARLCTRTKEGVCMLGLKVCLLGSVSGVVLFFLLLCIKVLLIPIVSIGAGATLTYLVVSRD